jgi:D-sedoheptulose 7-phosphate isomerase
MNTGYIEIYNEFKEYYINNLIIAIKSINIKELLQVVELILRTTEKRGLIHCCGNGGSAAIASHFSHNLNWDVSAKLPYNQKIKSIVLNEQACHMTGVANDRHYDEIFVEQLKNLLEINDLVIGISSSGNSENVIKAIEYVKMRTVKYVTITGQGGGELKKLGGININVNSNDQQITEDTQNAICHMIVRMLYYSHNIQILKERKFPDLANLRDKELFLRQKKT